MQAGTFEYSNGILAASTAAALGTVDNTQRYNRMAFSIVGLTSETVSVTISYDWMSGGTGTFEAAKVRPIDLATGGLTASSDLTNGSFMIVNTPWRAIKFTKSSTSESATVRWATLNAN
jgi:hypothetical protein